MSWRAHKNRHVLRALINARQRQIFTSIQTLLRHDLMNHHSLFAVEAWGTCTVSVYDITLCTIQTRAVLFATISIVTRSTRFFAQAIAPAGIAGASPIPRVALGFIKTLTVVAAMLAVLTRWTLC